MHENFRRDETFDWRFNRSPSNLILFPLCTDRMSTPDSKYLDTNLSSSVVEVVLDKVSRSCTVSVLEAVIDEFLVVSLVAQAVLDDVSGTRTVSVLDIIFNICLLSSHLSNSSRSRACLANISSHIFLGAGFR